MAQTLSFSEKNKGWTSFYGWVPSLMCSLNNKFLSIKDGQLWEHHDRENPIKNNFYGEDLPSKVVTIFNENFDFDKIYKALIIEGNKPWSVKLFTNYTEGTLANDEFVSKESRFFAYLRGTEDVTDMTGLAIQGVGDIVSVAANVITLPSIPDSVNIGDEIYQINAGTQELVGVVSAYTDTTISVTAIINAPIPTNFCYIKKNSRIEGSEIRGYYMQVELENSDGDFVELFAINTNEVKSYV